ncbi:hypothetical protein Tco_0473052 [Tanacetum coccineum]
MSMLEDRSSYTNVLESAQDIDVGLGEADSETSPAKNCRRDLFAGIGFVSVDVGSLVVFRGNDVFVLWAAMVVTMVFATSSMMSCGEVPIEIERTMCKFH